MNSFPQNPVFIHLDVVDSTNNYAANLLKQTKVVNGTVIMTKRQEKGKGQRGTTWQSEPDKNLICSVILDLNWQVQDVFDLNMITALALSDVLKDEGIKDVKVKWPNDVYANGKKIAGILIETQLSGQMIKSAILGIGLNVNQENFYGSFDATSVTLEKNLTYNVNLLAKTCWLKLVNRLSAYKVNGKGWVKATYYDHLMGFGEISAYRDDDGPFQGRITGIDEAGRLCIEKENGVLKAYQIKEVKQFV